MSITIPKKLILINGSTRGLGYSIVQLLVQNELTEIYCLVRDTSQLSNLKNVKQKIKIFKCDYSNFNDVNSIQETLFCKINFSDFDEIYFINNCAVLGPIDEISKLCTSEIFDSLNINIYHNFIVIKHFLNFVSKFHKHIYILNISSAISKSALPGCFTYGLSKAYLDYLTLQLNSERPSFTNQLFTTSFYPGGIDSQMQIVLQNKLRIPSLISYDYSKIYNQKLTKPEIIAEYICEHFVYSNIGWNSQFVYY